jgi:hypothetical protein
MTIGQYTCYTGPHDLKALDLRPKMRVSVADIEGRAAALFGPAAWACGWLEACGYQGLAMLAEAVKDAPVDFAFERDALGIDLKNVSCVFTAERIADEVQQNGRAFLRNVRHGLYLVPFAVERGLGIGCPVDPAFALGGPRAKDPYSEKLALARADGVELSDASATVYIAG